MMTAAVQYNNRANQHETTDKSCDSQPVLQEMLRVAAVVVNFSSAASETQHLHQA